MWRHYAICIKRYDFKIPLTTAKVKLNYHIEGVHIEYKETEKIRTLNENSTILDGRKYQLVPI